MNEWIPKFNDIRVPFEYYDELGNNPRIDKKKLKSSRNILTS